MTQTVVTVVEAVQMVLYSPMLVQLITETFNANTLIEAAVAKAAWHIDAVLGEAGFRCEDSYEAVKTLFVVAA